MPPLRLLVAVLALASGLAAQDGGIEIFAGETIFREGTRVSFTTVRTLRSGLRRGGSPVPDPLDQRYEERRHVLGVEHGVARRWSMSVLMPWVERSLEANTGNLRGEGQGDAALILKHGFHKQDWPRGAWHSAWLLGVETPTGSTRERDGGARLGPGLQPGSGSWDPFVGVASTLDLDLWRFDAVALFKANREGAQDFEQGDRLTLSLAGKYRWLFTRYPGPTASVTLGVKWRHDERSRQRGARVANTGGEDLLGRFALGWHPRPDVDLGLSYERPLRERLHGRQLGLDNRIQLALGWRF